MLKSPLDRETLDYYTLVVTASDGHPNGVRTLSLIWIVYITHAHSEETSWITSSVSSFGGYSRSSISISPSPVHLHLSTTCMFDPVLLLSSSSIFNTHFPIHPASFLHCTCPNHPIISVLLCSRIVQPDIESFLILFILVTLHANLGIFNSAALCPFISDSL